MVLPGDTGRYVCNTWGRIFFADEIPTHPVQMLSDRWLKGYPNLCTWVPRASTFKLLSTEGYRHADTSRPIPFNSPRRAEFNSLCPDALRPLTEGLSILLYFSSITLAGIAYLIIKSEVYGFIRWPHIRTQAPGVMSFTEASGRRLGILNESTFQDMFNWLEQCLEITTPLIF